jgi:hypothetical protein
MRISNYEGMIYALTRESQVEVLSTSAWLVLDKNRI